MNEDTKDPCRCCGGSGMQSVNQYSLSIGAYRMEWHNVNVLCPVCEGVRQYQGESREVPIHGQ